MNTACITKKRRLPVVTAATAAGPSAPTILMSTSPTVEFSRLPTIAGQASAQTPANERPPASAGTTRA